MQVVVRALGILRSVAAAETPVSIADLSVQLQLPPPTVHRFLSVLAEQGFVAKDEQNRRYSAGPEVARLVAAQRTAKLPEVAQPVLEWLSQRFDETVFVAARAEERAVCVSVLESSHPLRLNLLAGDVLPWHAAASARSILAFLPEGSAARLIHAQGMDRFTSNTPQSLAEVDRHLVQLRARGYDVCDDELDSGVWAAAAPILSPHGEVVGSVTLGAPGGRLATENVRAEVIGAVREAATKIAGATGAMPG